MYAFDSRVRFSEADHHETITLPGIINYFQDCSIFHSEDIGLGIDYLKEKKRAWVLTSWQIIVDRYPRIGEKIKVGTWATEFNGLYGHRNFCMWDEKGERAACANSIWAFMDLERGRPAKPLPASPAANHQPIPAAKASTAATPATRLATTRQRLPLRASNPKPATSRRHTRRSHRSACHRSPTLRGIPSSFGAQPSSASRSTAEASPRR